MLLLRFIWPGLSKEERWTADNLACNISVSKYFDKIDIHYSLVIALGSKRMPHHVTRGKIHPSGNFEEHQMTC